MITPECKNIMVGLLNKYPHKRLGHKGADDIRNHPWFKDVDWEALMQLKVKIKLFR